MKKKFLLFFIGCLYYSFASAQYNFYKFSVGAGPAATLAFGDLPKNFIKPAGVLVFDYLLTPYVSIGVEMQKGTLTGGHRTNITIDPHHRYFKNSFTSVVFSGKVQLGQFIDFERTNLLYAIRGFYVGTGVGMINNKMADINRTKINPDDGSVYTFPGVDKGTDIMIPINTGVNFNFKDKQWGYTRFILQAGYQLNMVLGESLDGYNDPSEKFENYHGDFYGITTVSFKYCFGTLGLY